MRIETARSPAFDASDRRGLRSRAGRGFVALLALVGGGGAGMAEALSLDPVLAQQVVEGRTADLDVPRRAGDVAGVPGQGLDQQPALGLVARPLERARALLLGLRQ